MILTIPVTPSVPAQDQTTTLDGRPYRFRFRWIQRISRWSVSIETGSGVSIVAAKGLVLGVDLLRQVRYRTDAPPGVLGVVDLEKGDVEPSLDTLGARHRVVYVSDADVVLPTGTARLVAL